MIKEKTKISKYNYQKTKSQILQEYLRTVLVSIFIAIVITSALSIHARNEMIKNLYVDAKTKQTLDKELAIRLINENADLMVDMQNKNYTVCMNIGKIFETAGDYKTAEMAYRFAADKSRHGKYTVHYRLICMLLEQNKFSEADKVLNSFTDHPQKELLKFKTRSCITIGDKYYSAGKYISAGKYFEKAEFYYNKFSKKDKVITDSIDERIRNAHIKTADYLVQIGRNSDAIKFLKKVEKKYPKDYKIQYKIALVLSDNNPEEAVKYIENLLEKVPQEVDYGFYGTTLMKAANNADLDGRTTQAKYYRYKICSIDLLLNNKVIYKNDIETNIVKLEVKKRLFTYPINMVLNFSNNSSTDIKTLQGDFVLKKNNKPVETITMKIADKSTRINSGGQISQNVNIRFKKAIFTKKELSNYTISILLYKNKKFKTTVAEIAVPQKSYYIDE
ncbi:MAG: hypothetical protein MJ237_04440 [bacterium]|nr:hypothetical protein [bacterium]